MSNEDASTVAGVILIVLGIITVASRFYSRWFTKAGFGWDDWTILIAMLTGIVPGALTIWGTFFYIVSPFPNPSSRIRFCIATYMSGEYTCMPWVERANKTDAPISKQRIRDGARRRQQHQPRLRLHSGRCPIHQDHVLDHRAILFHRLYHQNISPAPPPPHLRHQQVLQDTDIYRRSGSRSVLDLGYGGRPLGLRSSGMELEERERRSKVLYQL